MTDPGAAMGPTRLIAAPWATIADLPSSRADAFDPDYEELLWQASETLYLLTGRQWPGRSTVTRRLVRVGNRYAWTVGGQLAAAAWPVAPAWRAYDTGTGWRTLQLPDSPVTAIDEVLVDGQAVDVDAQLPVGLISRRDGQPWPPSGAEVTYSRGLAPPAGGRTCAIAFTVELGKAWARDKTCRIPANATTVSREGITVTSIDKAEFLDKGRTGIPEIDQWITSVNPHRLQRRARVWSPDTAGRRA